MKRSRPIKRIGIIISVLFAGLILGGSALSAQSVDMDRLESFEDFEWGVRSFHRGYYNEAILSFERALSKKPENTIARSWLGRSYYRAGFEAEAVSQWQYLVREGTASSLVNSRLEELQSERGPQQVSSRREDFVQVQTIEAMSGEYRRFHKPTSIRSLPNADFLVTAFGSNEIVEMDMNGSIVNRYRGGLEGFDHPFDVAVLDDGSFFVSEYEGNRIARCNSRGFKELTFGKAGPEGKERDGLLGPQYLELLPDGRLLVSDWGNRRVCVFDHEGKRLYCFGGRSPRFEGLRGPSGIYYENGMVFVGDRKRGYIAVFDEAGNYLKTLGAGRLKGPEGISSFAPGKLLVADTDRLVVLDIEQDAVDTDAFAAEGRQLLFAEPDSNGNVLLADFDSDQIHVYSDLSSLYGGLSVDLVSVNSANFPRVQLLVDVRRRSGEPLIGLKKGNFRLSEYYGEIDREQYRFVSSSLTDAADVDFSYAGNQLNAAGMVIAVQSGLADSKLRQAAEDLSSVLPEALPTDVVTAGAKPSLTGEAPLSKTGLIGAIREQSQSARTESDWSLDLGLRFSADRLITRNGKRAVVFLTNGRIDASNYTTYQLTELASYLENNGIRFYVVYLDNGAANEDLRYLSEKTGGMEIDLYRAEGLRPLVEHFQTAGNGRYMLSYRSYANPAFGKAYIPLRLEVYYMKRSGRDEIGFFPPVE
ncbi:MAG: hypothetical protein K9L68_00470 [Spirochaetales bacterium]|nr:hypothetical protein [Spirochaetales bacterium]MCF7937050.1 hypothetical protein [Spirochaetales bacterium]